MDIISRLPGCEGQASDAVSANTQVTMEGAPTLRKLPKSECPDIWKRPPRHKGPTTWQSIDEPGVPLEGKCMDIPLQVPLERTFVRTFSCRPFMGTTIREYFTAKTDGEKAPTWESPFVHRQQGLYLPEYVDDITMAGKTQNLEPTLKMLMNKVDLEKPTSFHDQVYLCCTQRECEPNNSLVDDCRKMFESRICAEATEKLPDSEKKRRSGLVTAWSCDMAGHPQKCVERYCELAYKNIDQLYKVSRPSSKKNWNRLENCQTLLSNRPKMPLSRIGRPDILWSVNNLV